jgi:hypothetical protein
VKPFCSNAQTALGTGTVLCAAMSIGEIDHDIEGAMYASQTRPKSSHEWT